MLVHKGGVRITEMSQLQNCSVICTKNGSYCENEKKREKVRGEGSGGMCTKNGSYCEKGKKSRGWRGGGVRVEKKKIGWEGQVRGGVVGSGGVRVM